MANKITNTDYYSAIANAIRRKNGETDTYTPAEMADAIGRIPQGGGGASENDVNFYDYDGSIVASYTAAQFAALEEMPENPDHTDEGLTSQGWNWSLNDAKTYVRNYGMLDIGQMYVPSDGKTHVLINIPKDDPSYETTLHFGHTDGAGQTVVDWGDGTPTETFSGAEMLDLVHTYVNPGNYEIKLRTISGKMKIGGNSSARFAGPTSDLHNNFRIIKVFIVNVDIGSYSFYRCNALKNVTIPHGVTSNIGQYTCAECFSLQSITIPDTVVGCSGYICYNCASLRSVSMPRGLSSIQSDSFRECPSLQRAAFIPQNITNIPGSLFYNSVSLKSVVIPQYVTRINSYAFYLCQSLQYVVIPSSVTRIDNHAFNTCNNMIVYHIKSSTPPTITSSSFSSIPSSTKIYVPAASLEAYKTATNWSTYADRMVAEPE